jgi:AcrR family transcriptional regulator
MGRPRQVSDERILEVMRHSVLTHGPSVSLDRVAEELEVSTPALLKRFGNRQALMLAALKPPKDPEWMVSIQKGPTDAPLEDQLLEMFLNISAFMEEVIPCISALRESGIPFSAVHPDPKVSGPVQGLKALQRWLAQARKRGLISLSETDSAAFALLGALQNRAFYSHILQMKFSKQSQHQYIKDLARLFSRALAT